MNRIMTLAIAAIAVTFASTQSAPAQDYAGGYQIGSGYHAACGGGSLRRTLEQPPYFAKYPPVYYSHIVKRPYGVSPYAAPSGIAPVEMSVPAPVTKTNPFYQPETAPVSDQKMVEPESTINKVTWQSNPYLGLPAAVMVSQRD